MTDICRLTGGYLHYFSQDWAGAEKYCGTGWANTEYRSYSFVDPASGIAKLEETAESRKRRAGDERPLTPDEQAVLKRTAEQDWDRDGYVSQGSTA